MYYDLIVLRSKCITPEVAYSKLHILQLQRDTPVQRH